MKMINHAGLNVDADEMIERYNEDQRAAKKIYSGSLLGIDMDNTMFDNDLGVLVFLEKLNDPHFWEFEVQEFSRLLMPRPYREALTRGANEEYLEHISAEMSQLALDLQQDCTTLYATIKRMIESKSKDKEMERIVIREFARKMVEFDQIFIRIDSHLTNLFDMPLLMRTRFFAGKELGDVHKMTERVMDRSETAVDRVIDLNLIAELSADLRTKVTDEQIEEAHGEESTHKEIDRLVITVREIHDIIRKALIEWENSVGVVFTANLHGIGETAVRNSRYDFLKKQGVAGTVVGSKLIREEGKLRPRMLGEPVLGKRKAREAVNFADRLGKHLSLAMGDSATTDGPMMREALRDGGSAIIVTKDIEAAKKRFHQVLNPAEIGYRTQERVYYLIPQIAAE